MKKIILFILLPLIIIIMGFYFLNKNKNSETDSNKSNKDKTVKVEKGDIILMVNATGRVVSNFDVDIKSKASGEVIKLPFDISDRVKKGDLLVELDPVDEQRNVLQKEANLEARKANLAQAKQNLRIAELNVETNGKTVKANLDAAQIKEEDNQARFKRDEELYAKKLVSKEELDASKTSTHSSISQLEAAKADYENLKSLEYQVELRKQDIILAESQLKNAEVDLEIAQRRLSETKIYAPMDGVVSTRNIQIGQIIASGISNVGGGTTILTLSDTSQIFIMASIDESDIGKLNLGQEAIITSDAYPNKRFKGKVVRIATKGSMQSNVVIFDVKIEVLSEGSKYLKPEMTANVEIIAESKKNILLLPMDAVNYGEDGYYVETVSSNLKGKGDSSGNSKGTINPERKNIEMGISDGLKTEIVKGLKEGDEIFVGKEFKSNWAKAGKGKAEQSASGQSSERRRPPGVPGMLFGRR